MISWLTLTWLLVAPTAPGAAPRQPDWAEALRSDAQALHDTVSADHPGPVDELNPQFEALNDRGLALALSRAETTSSFAGYWFAMMGYTASFDDGHLAFAKARDATLPPSVTMWPGFLTTFGPDGEQHVVTRAADASLPEGAALVSCDGRSAERLAADNVGAFEGRWSLESTRVRRGGELFLDRGNPWIVRPAVCVFRVDGEDRVVPLRWQSLTSDDLSARFAQTYSRAHDPIGLTTLDNGVAWLTLSDFDGDPDGDAAKALVPMIRKLVQDRTALLDAPAVVLDLRGNNGGSSDWSKQIAEVIWGHTRVAEASGGSDAVEWRASEKNIATLEEFAVAMHASPDASAEVAAYLDRAIAGMKGARAHDEPLWRDTSDDEPAMMAELAAPPTRPVYFLTDPGCSSACLDAADLWLALGAIHVGAETSADSLYMDVRDQPLPSGISRAVIPMKVYRGRLRGNNVPLTPSVRYQDDLSDTAAVQAWVGDLVGHQ